MAAAVPLRRSSEPQRRTSFSDGDGGGPGPGESPNGKPIVLGVLIFICSEMMMFAGLISAFLVSRAAASFWPPPNQPRLPIAITGVNTVLLLMSGVTMLMVVRKLRRRERKSAVRWMIVTSGLGTVFLAIQGSEWTRLIHYGLTMSSSLYGGMFYLIVGAHALHLAAALAVLSYVNVRLSRGAYKSDFRVIVACSAYWSFVVVLWPILYALVYLS